MKGIEETLSQAIFIIGSLVAAAILIYLASSYFPNFYEKESSISGNKDLILDKLGSIIRDCLNENSGKKESFICFQGKINFTGKISGKELSTELSKMAKCEKEAIIAEDLEGKTEIIISYKYGKIYIENK